MYKKQPAVEAQPASEEAPVVDAAPVVEEAPAVAAEPAAVELSLIHISVQAMMMTNSSQEKAAA